MACGALFNGLTWEEANAVMATLQEKIAEKFLAKLADSKNVDAAKVDELRALLSDGKKPKADDFIRIFSLPAGGDLK
jgi:flagellar biosynthesis/type III secretory pathway M-ring protein FliF/YscJ